jgi:acetyl esterase/lipase
MMAPVPLDPRVQALLFLFNRIAGGKDDLSILEARAADENMLARVVLGTGSRAASQEDVLIPVASGRIAVRLYRPRGMTTSRGPMVTGGADRGSRPLHVFFHGGGWCTGTVAQRDSRCRDIAAGAGCVVASVDYRLAPENPFPTAPEDCFAAVVWLAEHAAELGLDAGRISVGGESAGANLAAVVCLMTRDREGPRLLFQLLDVPATDLTMQQPSTHRLAQGYMLTRRDMERYVGWYLADPSRATDPYGSPLHAPDLRGLPPAVVTTCEFDPLRDEGAAYARRLEESGVPVVHRQLAGQIHVSIALPRLVPAARAHHEYCIRALKEVYAGA